MRKLGIIFSVPYSFRTSSFKDKRIGFDFAEIIALSMLHVFPILARVWPHPSFFDVNVVLRGFEWRTFFWKLVWQYIFQIQFQKVAPREVERTFFLEPEEFSAYRLQFMTWMKICFEMRRYSNCRVGWFKKTFFQYVLLQGAKMVCFGAKITNANFFWFW